jgi:hypothetical protein
MKIAYIAGLFDGEGCVRIYTEDNKKWFILQITISNTCVPLLLEIQKHYGGNVSGRRNGLCYSWSMTSKPAAEILKKMLPYLIVKKEQAEIAIEFQARKEHGGYWRDKQITEKELEIRREYMNKLKELKLVRYEYVPKTCSLSKVWKQR